MLTVEVEAVVLEHGFAEAEYGATCRAPWLPGASCISTLMMCGAGLSSVQQRLGGQSAESQRDHGQIARLDGDGRLLPFLIGAIRSREQRRRATVGRHAPT
ncbi:MAG: hypothetical protein U0703_09830 [Anaerolineae bacterium]